MSDNTTTNPGSGGDIIATDDVSGVKFQRVKLALGADGQFDGDVCDALPMPIAGTVELGASSLAALESVTAVGPLTDAQLRAAAVPVSGTVELGATSLAALESVTAVGPLTDTQLRASAVPVSGTVELGSTSLAALESVTAVGPLTNAELRATAVPVSGPLTDSQLRANGVDVDITSPNAKAAGIYATIAAYGYLRVTDEPTAQFYDPLDSLDTTNRWTAKNSTGTATVASGVLTVASSTTASAYGGLFTQPTFTNRGLNFLPIAAALAFDNSAIANSVRWFGHGSVPTTPTTSVPITNGTGFLLDGAGNLYAKIYANSAEVFSADLTAYKPADGTYTRYLIVERADLTFFYVGSTEVPVAIAQYKNPDIQTLPISILSVAGATPPATSATIKAVSIGVGDTGKNAQGVCDPAFPWRSATVKAASTAAAATDLPLVVALHPSSPTPASAAGTNLIGDVGLQVRANATGAATPFNYANPATSAGAQVKTTAGRILSISLTNTAASARFVKFFNVATAPTMGTTAAAYEYCIPAGGSINIAIPQGIAHGTGIFIAVTTAAGLTNNTSTTVASEVLGFITYA